MTSWSTDATEADRVRAPRPSVFLVSLWMLLAVIIGSVVFVLDRPWESSSETRGTPTAADDAAVTQATLLPARIVLVLRNGSRGPIRVAQVIVNDAYVDFRARTGALQPGDTEQLTVHYPWVRGESYEFELLTTEGDGIEYELDDAGTA
jgi:hypothetical protein